MKRQSSSTGPLPFCSTIRISIKVSTLKDSSQRKNCRRMKNHMLDEYDFRMDCILINHIRVAFREFLAFFYRHRIQICFAGSISDISFQSARPRIEKPIFNTFIKNYSWQMLLSIGYRFQQRLKQEFIDHLKRIESDDDFYRVSTLDLGLTEFEVRADFRRASTSGVEQKNITFSTSVKR